MEGILSKPLCSLYMILEVALFTLVLVVVGGYTGLAYLVGKNPAGPRGQ